MSEKAKKNVKKKTSKASAPKEDEDEMLDDAENVDIESLIDDDFNDDDAKKEIASDASVGRFNKFDLESLHISQRLNGISEESEKAIIEELKKSGIPDVPALAQKNEQELVEMKIKGLGKSRIKAVMLIAQKIMGGYDFESLDKMQFRSERWSSGTLCFDNLIGGGFATGNTYEVYGQYATGKTAICATACCRLFLKYDPHPVLDADGKEIIDPNTGKPLIDNTGGLVKEGEPLPKVFWLDTEDTFDKMLTEKVYREKSGISKVKVADDVIISDDDEGEKEVKIIGETKVKSKEFTRRVVHSRFRQIANGLGLDFDKDVRPNIIFSTARTPKEQVQKVKNALMNASTENIRLIIVDSITKLFRAERGDEDVKMNQLAKNSQILQHFFGMLNQLAASTPRGAAIVYTNQVYRDLDMWKNKKDQGTGRYTDIAYGGNAVFFNIDHRIHVFKQKGALVAELVDSSNNPSNMDTFMITSNGIEDTEE